MWKAKHYEKCKNKTQYLVIETTRRIQDASGCTLDDCHLDPQLIHTVCASCGAKSEWKTREVCQ